MSVPQSVNHVESDVLERSNQMWTYEKVFHNQNYVVMSIVEGTDGGDGTVNPPVVKIFGTFSSIEQANSASKTIAEENDFYHVYVAETNKWLPCPPSPAFIENVTYSEERLENIKNAYADLKDRNARDVESKIRKENALVESLPKES